MTIRVKKRKVSRSKCVPLQAIYEHKDETTISLAIAFGISADAAVVVVTRS